MKRHVSMGLFPLEKVRRYGHIVVIRSEENEVIIGRFTNIQDFVMIHVGHKTDTVIGDYCSIAHRAVIHGATIGHNTLIGVGAIVMDGAVIGNNVIVSAGAYVPSGEVIPDNTVYQGNPVMLLKERNNYVSNRMNAVFYNINARHYDVGDYRSLSHQHIKKEGRSFFVSVSKEYKRMQNETFVKGEKLIA